jgi:hypothetical protein
MSSPGSAMAALGRNVGGMLGRLDFCGELNRHDRG